MENNNNSQSNDQGGRPPVDDRELDAWLTKLKPFLQQGLSLHKACLQADIPYRTALRRYQDTEWFCQKVDGYLSYTAVMVNNIFLSRLMPINDKRNGLMDLRNKLIKGEIKQEDFNKLQVEYDINEDDWDFIKWYALNAKSTKGDYGTRMEVTGEDGAPLVPESPLKEVATMLQELLKGYGKQSSNPSTDTGDTGAGTQILQEQQG